MATFIGRRLLYLLPVLFAVTLLTFLIASLLPGDLASTILGDQATPEKVAALRAQMGLDLPIWQRYGIWLWDVLHGNLGRSFRTGETVWAAVTDRLPVSLELMVMTVALSLRDRHPARHFLCGEERHSGRPFLHRPGLRQAVAAVLHGGDPADLPVRRRAELAAGDRLGAVRTRIPSATLEASSCRR